MGLMFIASQYMDRREVYPFLFMATTEHNNDLSNPRVKLSLKPLKGYNSFGKHFESGKRFFSKNMMLSIIVRSMDSQSITFPFEIGYGVSVRKKVCPKAVVRNRIKRLLRECLREESSKWHAVNENISCSANYWESILLFWNKKIDKPGLIRLADIKKESELLFEKAYNYTTNLYHLSNDIG